MRSVAAQGFINEIRGTLVYQGGDAGEARPRFADFRFGRPEHALDNRPQFGEVVTQMTMDEIANVVRREQTIFGQVHVQEERHAKCRIVTGDGPEGPDDA